MRLYLNTRGPFIKSGYATACGGNTLTSMLSARLLNAFTCLAVAALFILAPVVGVAKPLPRAFLSSSQHVFYLLAFLTSFTAGFCTDPVRMKAWLRPQGVAAWNERLGYLTYSSLFLTSALLCMRMRLALFPPEIAPLVAYIGWLLTAIGGWMFVTGLAAPQRLPQIAYPHYLAIIFLASGLALSHFTWFPLLALPGFLVFMRWRIEKRASLEDPDTVSVSKARFKIVPFIY